jgi:cation:H+ antiporter
MDVLVGLVLFGLGAALAVWSTERLLEGLVGLALLVGLSSFVVGALLSGLEAENIAVALAASHGNQPALALGSVFGGATFLVCVALGLGGIIAPLRVRLPRPFLLLGALAPVLVGLALIGGSTARLSGAALLLCFAAAMAYLVLASRRRPLLVSEEVEEAEKERHGPLVVVALTILGLVAVSAGGELITEGAKRLVAHLSVPVLVMGMVVTPAVIELDEVVRQAVPAKEGHPEVSAGNLLGTLLYFTLCNLGLIALLAPVRTPVLVRTLDWPFLVAATWLAIVFLWRGRVGRIEGAILLAAYALYVLLHVLLR